ncbi:hypothetical protein [Microbulbifer sp. VAAF005]|uniref:hypothetical protein n=1 Tax=Microbulbifer sp. VAAF005 TaxID=3034230 RepID=UPI0024AD90D2|nr:hypothetical protein [Microbulbifer sp. VAAF005]WHI45438.1 hypothetical protein P0078_17135 [Microbulbifer sp. VAAF005]
MLVPLQNTWWDETIGENFNQPMGHTLNTLRFPENTTDRQISRLSFIEKQRLALILELSYTAQAFLQDGPSVNMETDTTSKIEA